MDFDLSEEQKMIVASAEGLGGDFGPDYWGKCEIGEAYPEAFFAGLSELGFFGLGLSEESGGSGAGITETALAMEALCRSGGGGGPALGYLFGLLGAMTVQAHGNEAQRAELLPKMAEGKMMCGLGLSESDAGTNTLNIKTFARKEGDEYVINGSKWFSTNIERSDATVLVVRTTKLEDCARRSDGISLFLVDLPNPGVSFQPISKHAFNYYKSHSVFLEDARVPASSLLGEEGKGFYQLLGTLNPERILVASGAIGTARLALKVATDYAGERTVFSAPIGSHQAIQHPMASAYAKLEAAWTTTLKAAWMHDAGKPQAAVGAVANTAKYLAVEAALEACSHAMQTHGGAGFAKDYHVERWFREVQLFRLAPVTQQMTLNYIGEHVMGLPRSY